VQDIDGLAALDARVPVGVVGDPVVASEEHRLRDHDAAVLEATGTGEHVGQGDNTSSLLTGWAV